MRSPFGSDERGVACPRVVVGEAAHMASVVVVAYQWVCCTAYERTAYLRQGTWRAMCYYRQCWRYNGEDEDDRRQSFSLTMDMGTTTLPAVASASSPPTYVLGYVSSVDQPRVAGQVGGRGLQLSTQPQCYTLTPCPL